MKVVIKGYRQGDEIGTAEAYEKASAALELVEGGLTVSYSDRYRFDAAVDDPALLQRLLGHALRCGCFPIEVEVVEVKAVEPTRVHAAFKVEDEEGALRALEYLEEGFALRYSDKSALWMRIDDPDLLVGMLKQAWVQGSFPAKVEVID